MRRSAIALAIAVAACGNGDGGGQQDAAVADGAVADAFVVDPSTCTDEQAVRDNVLNQARCASTDCHDNQFPAAMLDLQSIGLQARLIGAPALPPCDAEIFVVPGDPDASYLVDKLDPNPACGARMPLTGGPLSPSQIECVRNWISGL